ncbi:MAG: hypothetical protein H6510_17945 [Acidobacteria bacterium]|nr:hypothetical protein [Acidobacteriota bacterium]MCB9399700.1 hypothetical protein [Acidobacteriota bacterium]
MSDWQPLSDKVLAQIRKERVNRRRFLVAGTTLLLGGLVLPWKRSSERPYDEPVFEYHAPDGVSLVYFEVTRDF